MISRPLLSKTECLPCLIFNRLLLDGLLCGSGSHSAGAMPVQEPHQRNHESDDGDGLRTVDGRSGQIGRFCAQEFQ